MRIPDINIEKFQAIYKDVFGVDIDTEDAQTQGLAMLRLVAARYEDKLNDLKEDYGKEAIFGDDSGRVEGHIVHDDKGR